MNRTTNGQHFLLKATYVLQDALADAIDHHAGGPAGLDRSELRLAAEVLDRLLRVPLESNLIPTRAMLNRCRVKGGRRRPRLALVG